METMATVFLANHRGSDGIASFSREILFRTAGDWAEEALPRDICGTVYFLHEDDTPPLHDTTSIICPTEERYRVLSQQACIFAADSILIVAAPMPELTRRDYLRLISMHTTSQNDVTVMCCDGGVNEPFALMRDTKDTPTSISHGEGERVLHAALFRTAVLRGALREETDSLYAVINAATAAGAKLGAAHTRTVTEIVSGTDAYLVQKRLTERINFWHISRGVMIFSPDTTYIAPDAEISAGATILPGTLIRAGCRIGAYAVIGPNAILEKASVGAYTTVNNSQIYESAVGEHATVGPFAYIRPGCTVGDHTRIGDFVELKNAEIGNGTKVSHLTYIGDAQVGERVNFGCGTVVVNYDGYLKSKTEIGDDCFIGCNTNLVAPVKLGDRVFTAAGATITSDVPDGALAVARARQKNLEGWNDRRREAHGQLNDSNKK